MSETSQRVISLVKIRSWFVPKDMESYQILRSVGIPSLKIPQEFVPVLSLLLKKHQVRAKQFPFRPILDAKIDQITSAWIAAGGQDGYRVKIQDKRLVLTGPNTPRCKKRIAKIDNALLTFFQRWGYSYAPDFSELGDRCKFTADFNLNSALLPVIQGVEEEVKDLVLELGFTKITFKWGIKPDPNLVPRKVPLQVGFIEVHTKAGDNWIPVHHGSFVPQTVGDLASLIEVLSKLALMRHTTENGI